MMTTNLFVIANVKQLRTEGSFRILLNFFRTSWSVGVLNSAIFNSFHNRIEFGTILEGLRNFGGGEVEHPKPPPLGTPLFTTYFSTRGTIYATDTNSFFRPHSSSLLTKILVVYGTRIFITVFTKAATYH